MTTPSDKDSDQSLRDLVAEFANRIDQVCRQRHNAADIECELILFKDRCAALPETQPREGDDHPGPIAPLKGDTPMTDAAIERGECGPDFARQLERKLAEANRLLDDALHTGALLATKLETARLTAPLSARPCTCHPDDNPPRPCPQKYALTECREAAARSTTGLPAELTDERFTGKYIEDFVDRWAEGKAASGQSAFTEADIQRLLDFAVDLTHGLTGEDFNEFVGRVLAAVPSATQERKP